MLFKKNEVIEHLNKCLLVGLIIYLIRIYKREILNNIIYSFDINQYLIYLFFIMLIFIYINFFKLVYFNHTI